MSYKAELIDAKHSEGVYGVALAIAFISFAATRDSWVMGIDIALAVLFLTLAVKDFRRERQIRREA